MSVPTAVSSLSLLGTFEVLYVTLCTIHDPLTSGISTERQTGAPRSCGGVSFHLVMQCDVIIISRALLLILVLVDHFVPVTSPYQ